MAVTLADAVAALKALREAQRERDYLRGPYNLRLKGAARAAKLNALENELHAARDTADEVIAAFEAMHGEGTAP